MLTRALVSTFLLSLLPLPVDAAMCAQGIVAGKVTNVSTAKNIELDGFYLLRLGSFAAPEWDESGGQRATKAMRSMLLGTAVRCVLNGDGLYDRCVANCYLDGADIAEMMVAAGLARDCPRYSGGRYQEAEHQAKQQGATIGDTYKLPGYCDQAAVARPAAGAG